MASSSAANGAAGLQQNRRRPTVPRPIVPAIPMSYVQKRQQQRASRVKLQEEGATPAVGDAPKVDRETTPSPAVAATQTHEAGAPPATVEAAVPAAGSADQPAPLVVNGSTRVESPKEEEHMVEDKQQATAIAPSTPAVDLNEGDSEKETMEDPVVTSQESMSDEHEHIERQTPSQSDNHSDNQSTLSRATFQVPPAPRDVVPTNSNQTSVANPEAVHFHQQHISNGNFVHHTQPSNGSVVFGGYSESTNSSPAPPLSAGIPPPPSFGFHANPHSHSRHMTHQSNGGHSHHLSNGYPNMPPPPPAGYYPQQDRYWTGNENFARRPIASFGPPDGYSPSATPVDHHQHAFDPQAPRSLHGSQSSHQDHEVGPPFYNQFPPNGFVNGGNGPPDNARVHPNSRDNKPRNHVLPFIPHPPPAVQFPHHPDQSDGLIPHLQQQFADSTFADWTLELRYTDDRSQPVQIPGHGIIFARSPLLRYKMLALSGESHGVIPRRLLIESSDVYLRSDGFWMAMQRLYGAELLALGALSQLPRPGSQEASAMPGNTFDRFDLSLGYAAAGHLLQMPQVVRRGIEIASRYITWANLEKAVDFGIDGELDPAWPSIMPDPNGRYHATYGPAVGILLHYAMNFIVANFPADFEFDVTVSDPERNRRLPFVADARPISQNPRFAGIQFGTYPTLAELPKSPNAILSRILLNLPFPLLRYIAEARPLGQSTADATRLSAQVLRDVIDEREKRRVKVQNSHIPNAERSAKSKDWDAVGWQEEFEPSGREDSPSGLFRSWIDFTVPVNSS